MPGKLSAEELDEIVTGSVVPVARFLGQRLADRLNAHQLNPVHFGVLAYLVIESEMTQAELARAVLMRPQSIAPVLDVLQDRGFILRTGHRARGRRNPVQITGDGRRALDTIWDLAISTNDLSDAGLTMQESVELNRLLLKIIRTTQGPHREGSNELSHPDKPSMSDDDGRCR